MVQKNDYAEIEAKIAEMTDEELEAAMRDYQERLLNVGEKYHHNAKLLTLIKQWDDYLAEQARDDKLTPMQLRRRLQQDLLKLVRVKITNHNPAKQGITGEIVVVGNSVIGEVRRFVPYNSEAAEAYHLPRIIVTALKERQYAKRNSRTIKGRVHVEIKQMPEFYVQELEPLTEIEMKELARRQQLSKGVELADD